MIIAVEITIRATEREYDKHESALPEQRRFRLDATGLDTAGLQALFHSLQRGIDEAGLKPAP